MKWGVYSNEAETRVTKFLNKIINTRALYILFALAALVLLSGATDKWGR